MNANVELRPVNSEETIVRARVVDVSIPFFSMVGLLVKLALASIPAVIILVIIGLIVAGIIGAFGVSTIHH